MFNIRLTPIVKNLIIANVVVFLLIYAMRRMLDPATLEPILNDYTALYKTNWLGFFGGAYESNFKLPQLVTHFFAHYDPMHILFNMFALASLGPAVERVLGPKRFLRFYLFCGIVGGIIIAVFDPSSAPIIGASGAIFGVMAYFSYYYPTARLSVFFLPPIEAKKLMAIIVGASAFIVLLIILGNFVPALSGFDGWGISHFGHLSGVIAAVIYFYTEKMLIKPSQ